MRIGDIGAEDGDIASRSVVVSETQGSVTVDGHTEDGAVEDGFGAVGSHCVFDQF